MTLIDAIEEATRRALVAEEHAIDGWWLRCNPDLRNRRPNAATTPPHGPIDLTVVGEVIGWYVARGRSPIIRVLSTSDTRLERHLDEKGWSVEAPTRVMVSNDLDGFRPVDAAVFDGADGLPAVFDEVRVAAGLSMAAAQLVHEMGRGANAGYAAAPRGDAPVAVGRAEMEGALVGLYDVVTLPAARRQGWASEVVRGLVRWAVGHGAQTAFLQVEEANTAAIALYQDLGFTTHYTYCYRRPPVG